MLSITSFRKKFKITAKADLRDVAVADEAISHADAVASEYLANVEPVDHAAGLRIHSLLNLLSRVFEHAEAMLVAVATGSSATSEAIARIVVEGSINIQYLAAKGDTGTLLQFFREWTVEHSKKLLRWKEEIRNEDYAATVGRMIDVRREVVLGFSEYVSILEKQCAASGANVRVDWPTSIFKSTNSHTKRNTLRPPPHSAY